MGIEIQLKAGDNYLTVSPSTTDWKVLELLWDDPTAADAVSQLVDMEDFGAVQHSKRAGLLQALTILLEAVQTNANRLPYVYEFWWTPHPEDPRLEGGTGGVSFTINGVRHALTAGLGYCELQRYEVDNHGHGQVVERKDVRDTKYIQTDNNGKITIRRYKKKLELVRLLTEVKQFLEAHPEVDVVEKIIG